MSVVAVLQVVGISVVERASIVYRLSGRPPAALTMGKREKTKGG